MKRITGIFVLLFILTLALAACGSKIPDKAEGSPPAAEREWEPVSRGYRITGIIQEVKLKGSELESISLKVTKNGPDPSNPIDYDLTNKTLDIYFNHVSAKDKGIDQLKKNTEIVTVIAQYALPNGKVIFGTSPEWIYFPLDGAYIDLQGNKATEDELN